MNDHDDPGLDARLRDALGRAAAAHEPAPVTDAEALADRIAERAAGSGGPTGPAGRGSRRTLGIVGAVGAVLGGALGGGLGIARGDGTTTGATAQPVASTSLWRCRGEGPVGRLAHGDRIVLTGRSDDGVWLQLRSPADLAARVWVAANVVRADDAVDALPVASCGDEIAPTGPTTTLDPADTTTTTSTATTTTTTPGPTTTLRVATTTVPSPSPTPAPTTTVAADTTGPALSDLGASPATIWTLEQPGVPCVPAKPLTTTVAVSATDPSGVASARVDWSVNGPSGTVTMSRSGSTWLAPVGNFAANTLPTSGPSMNQTVTLVVRVTDGAGNVTSATTTVQLRSSAECFG